MRKQQRIWKDEHANPSFLPGLNKTKPSAGLVAFFESFDGKVSIGKAVDVGSGKGRNAIYLAQKGFDVYCIEYIEEALDVTRKIAQQERLSDKINLYNTGIDEKWPFDDNFFDLAIDSFSSIDIEINEGREIYKKELFRTLKPSGYAYVGVVSADDEIESSLPRGEEPNSVIWPNGKFQKNYDEEELRNFYADFEIVSLKKVSREAFKLTRNYTATNFQLILRKS